MQGFYMCAIIEYNSDMPEHARRSKQLPGGLHRWKAAVCRWKMIRTFAS